jgi:hypothetical protein
MRNPLSALALVLGLVSPAVADDDRLTAQDVAQLKHLLQPKFLVAEVIEAAGFAAEKCPGLHLIEHNIEAEYHSAGAADDDMNTPEFQLMSARGRTNAAEGYQEPGCVVRIHVELPGPGAPTDGEAYPSPAGLSGLLAG